MPTLKKPMPPERREHHVENPLVNLRPKPVPNHTQAAVIGRALFQDPYPRNARTDRLS